MIERFYGSLKYEHLYRLEIADAWTTEEIESYRQLFNEIRPHEHLDFGIPMDAYLRQPN